jgi:hypothetical protein
MRSIGLVSAIVLCSSLNAMVVAKAPKPATANTPPTDANLFIYREKAEPTLIKARIEIDGRVRAKLGNKSYTAFSVSPGVVFVKANWPSEKDESNLPMPVEIKPGIRYYFQLVGKVESWGSDAARLKFSHNSELQPVSEAEGANKIAACCKYRAADD